MALASTTVWEVNAGSTVTANKAGGGFNPANANMMTDLTTNANTANTNSPIVSSATYNFVAGDVGNWLYIQSTANNWVAGWYIITNANDGTSGANKAVVNATIGTAIQTSQSGRQWNRNTVAGIATTGTPTNGVFTIDYSQATTSIINGLTDFAQTAGSTTATGTTFTKAMTGNLIHLTALTGTGAIIGWYEISSVTNSTTIVLDRTATNGVNNITAGTYYVGGALSFNSTLDDDVLEAMVAGSQSHWKNNGTINLGEAVSIALDATVLFPNDMNGYNTLRGDEPTGTNRPTIATGSLNFIIVGNYWNVYNFIFTGTGTITFQTGNTGKTANVKSTNSSTTTTRVAFGASGNGTLTNCEGISYRGYGVNVGAIAVVATGCTFHDSDVGFRFADNSTATHWIINCIIHSNVTAAYASASSGNNYMNVFGNTLYGAENKLGIGISWNTSNKNMMVINNIIYGFATGVNHPDVVLQKSDDYNDYFNNTTDVSNWIKGKNDLALNPTFTSVTQITGTAGAFVAGGSKLVDTSKNFTNLGVLAGDTVLITGGTGAPAVFYYLIDSISTTTNPNDTLNITIPASPGTNTTADKTYQITLPRNFAIGTNLKAAGFPGAFQGGIATGYLDMGAVQRQETSSGGAGGFMIT